MSDLPILWPQGSAMAQAQLLHMHAAELRIAFLEAIEDAGVVRLLHWLNRKLERH